MKLRILFCVIGVFMTGVGVGIMKGASFGVDPFQSLMSGLDAVLPLPFWVIFAAVGTALLLFALFSDRSYIGLGTLLTLFLQGYVIDWTRNALFMLISDLNLLQRGICFLIGIGVLCISSAMYYEASLGVSPYDSVVLLLSEKYRIGKFQSVRVACDLVCVALGAGLLLVSGASTSELFSSIGPGTLITAICMGPIVAWLRNRLFSRLLHTKARQARSREYDTI